MANKVSYANLNLKIDTSVTTFDFCGQTVEVLKYLPADEKYDLLMITLQEAEEDGIYNDFKLDVFFHLNLVYMYSNLSFTEKQKENPLKIYDTLMSNGFFGGFLSAMNEDEYENMYNALLSIANEKTKYNSTFAAIFKSFTSDLSKNAKAAADIVDNFKPEQYQAVLDFVNAANGQRNFKTNQPLTAK